MGGAVDVPGNVTPFAEFNVYNDPVAAHMVFSSGVPVTLVGLDVCDRVFAQRDYTVSLSGGSRSEKLASRILTNWFKSRPDSARYSLCDPLAVAAIIQRDLLTYKRATVTVETEDQERIGKTGARYGAGNVEVATAVRVSEAKEVITSLLRL